MAPVRNARLLFNSIPTGYPEPGKTTVYDTSETFDVENVNLNGGFLLKTLVLSVDPYMRGKMHAPDPAAPAKKSDNEQMVPEQGAYAEPYYVGQPLYGHGVGVVLRSEFDGVKPGDHVYGVLKYQEYDIVNTLYEHHIVNNAHNLPWSVYVGAAGMPGITAFAGWKEYAHPKKGETVFVTTGGGPVGSLVIQLAKLDGLKVVASAGSDEKVQFMKDIGADVAFNYKTTSTEDVLKEEGPIDVFWDGVGGETLDLALKYANLHARFIECGMISAYNTGTQNIKNLIDLLRKNITMSGFIIIWLAQKYFDEFITTIPAKIASGEIKYTEEIFDGLETAGEAILAVQKGTNKGKAVVLVAKE